MRIAICDDEEVQRKLLAGYLQEWAKARDIFLKTECFSSAESLEFAWEDDRNFDLLILDIEMGKLSGMELAVKIREKNEEVPVLFITGYEKYMAQGYEVSALHYLLKPVHKEKLFDALDRLRKTKKPEEKFSFRREDSLLLLPASSIWYMEAMGHKCLLAEGDLKHEVHMSISEAVSLFGGRKEFVQCHRSYIVNLQHASSIAKTEIVMDDGTRIPISRSAGKAVNEAFIRNYLKK